MTALTTAFICFGDGGNSSFNDKFCNLGISWWPPGCVGPRYSCRIRRKHAGWFLDKDRRILCMWHLQCLLSCWP